MPKNCDIGWKIKKLRSIQKLSQERFGCKIGISGKSVSAYENGACTPSMRVMEAISSVYGVDLISSSSREYLLNTVKMLRSQLADLENSLNKKLPF